MPALARSRATSSRLHPLTGCIGLVDGEYVDYVGDVIDLERFNRAPAEARTDR
ncbi:hypothetical protein ACFQO4_09870 [Saliphagus sp. GCM10025334]